MTKGLGKPKSVHAKPGPKLFLFWPGTPTMQPCLVLEVLRKKLAADTLAKRLGLRYAAWLDAAFGKICKYVGNKWVWRPIVSPYTEIHLAVRQLIQCIGRRNR